MLLSDYIKKLESALSDHGDRNISFVHGYYCAGGGRGLMDAGGGYTKTQLPSRCKIQIDKNCNLEILYFV